jgi:hypothetical protein
LSPGRVKNFLFAMSSRPALGSTQPPIQRVPRALSPRVKRQDREADGSLPANVEVKKNVDLYIHSPIRLHGIVLNQLSTGTTLHSYVLRNLHEYHSSPQRCSILSFFCTIKCVHYYRQFWEGGDGLEFNPSAYNTQTVLYKFKIYKLKIIPGL